MDVVIQFAIHKLGFQLSDIVVYAWSIGGFTGTQRQEQYNPVTKTKVVILFKIEIQTMQSFAFKCVYRQQLSDNLGLNSIP